MSRVRSKNTAPEMLVRRLTHAMGYRYRLHVKDLPGKPDLVFSYRHKVIFVHGCFWHRHEGCTHSRMPKSNRAFWRKKFAGNVKRDSRNQILLAEMGWEVLLIWEYQINDVEALGDRIRQFLEG